MRADIAASARDVRADRTTRRLRSMICMTTSSVVVILPRSYELALLIRVSPRIFIRVVKYPIRYNRCTQVAESTSTWRTMCPSTPTGNRTPGSRMEILNVATTPLASILSVLESFQLL